MECIENLEEQPEHEKVYLKDVFGEIERNVIGGNMGPPEIENSTKQERKQYIKDTFWCRGDCDICGICQVYRGQNPVIVYEEYIEGKKTFQEITERYR